MLQQLSWEHQPIERPTEAEEAVSLQGEPTRRPARPGVEPGVPVPVSGLQLPVGFLRRAAGCLPIAERSAILPGLAHCRDRASMPGLNEPSPPGDPRRQPRVPAMPLRKKDRSLLRQQSSAGRDRAGQLGQPLAPVPSAQLSAPRQILVLRYGVPTERVLPSWPTGQKLNRMWISLINAWLTLNSIIIPENHLNCK